MSELRAILTGTMLEQEPMYKHTSYGIGGPAAAYIMPRDTADLAAALAVIKHHRVPFFIAGAGSNLLVSDAGFDGVIISLEQTFTKLSIQGTTVTAESGVRLGHLVRRCVRQSLAGLENLTGIPGTVGGAVAMNAGAFGSAISDHLVQIQGLTADGNIRTLPAAELHFEYRRCKLPPGMIILKATFELEEGPAAEIRARKEQISTRRKTTQPLRYPSAGSVFRNPAPGRSAGRLIEQAGLKGTRRGDAEISTRHANFFINRGRARAADVIALINLARRTVAEKFGIRLELELKTLGFPGDIFPCL